MKFFQQVFLAFSNTLHDTIGVLKQSELIFLLKLYVSEDKRTIN